MFLKGREGMTASHKLTFTQIIILCFVRAHFLFGHWSLVVVYPALPYIGADLLGQGVDCSIRTINCVEENYQSCNK